MIKTLFIRLTQFVLLCAALIFAHNTISIIARGTPAWFYLWPLEFTLGLSHLGAIACAALMAVAQTSLRPQKRTAWEIPRHSQHVAA